MPLLLPHVGYGPFPVTVTTRTITFLEGNPYKPLFVTVTGKGPHPIPMNEIPWILLHVCDSCSRLSEEIYIWNVWDVFLRWIVASDFGSLTSLVTHSNLSSRWINILTKQTQFWKAWGWPITCANNKVPSFSDTHQDFSWSKCKESSWTIKLVSTKKVLYTRSPRTFLRCFNLFCSRNLWTLSE